MLFSRRTTSSARVDFPEPGGPAIAVIVLPPMLRCRIISTSAFKLIIAASPIPDIRHGLAVDQLCRQLNLTRLALSSDLSDQCGDCRVSKLVHRASDNRNRGRNHLRPWRIVKADERYVGPDGKPKFVAGGKHAPRHLLIRGKYSGRARLVGQKLKRAGASLFDAAAAVADGRFAGALFRE